MVSGFSETTRKQTQPHTVSARVRTTIQSIKEIVGDFSDADIYMAPKETNMDPNETAQKLLNQDPFHEVKRKKDKKSLGYRGFVDPRKVSENSVQGEKSHLFTDHDARRGGYARPFPENAIKEFRVVRDNRSNGNLHKDVKPDTIEQGTDSIVVIDSIETLNGVKPSVAKDLTTLNGSIDSQPRRTVDANRGASRKVKLEDKRNSTSNPASQVQIVEPNDPDAALASSIVGVHSSSTDPVHVPSPDSKSPAAIGTIRRKVGVVGGRQLIQGKSTANTPVTPVVEKGRLLTESFQSHSSISKTHKASQSRTTELAMPSTSVRKLLPINHYAGKPHQNFMGHQKALQQNKEWKPKSIKKPSVISSGVNGTPASSILSPVDNCKELDSTVHSVKEKLLHENISENQNVIIAQHIRVPATDRSRLTFGSFGLEHASEVRAVRVAENSNMDSAVSLTVSTPESTGDNVLGSNQADILDCQVRNSDSDSPVLGETTESQFPDKNLSSENLDNYGHPSFVGDDTSSYAPAELQQQQNAPDLSSFLGYDQQTVYDFSHFRTHMDEAVRENGLLSPQEGLITHASNNIPTSSMPLVQQQQPPLAQMYPQVHVQHFTNMMPYRQIVSPFYVQQMGMAGYSSNTAYSHSSNGGSYLLMPGGNSHHNANGLKYGIQQFKPVPGSNLAGFGNFASPTRYPVNTSGVVGNGITLEDSSWIKYREGNLYVPNPQAETSEIWMQNPREVTSMQSSPYYNVPATSPHAAYLPVSFNSTTAQSSHMQFPGLYTPPLQPTAMTNPHHLGPIMGGNVGIGVEVAPSAAVPQIGGYHQPQLNWTANF